MSFPLILSIPFSYSFKFSLYSFYLLLSIIFISYLVCSNNDWIKNFKKWMVSIIIKKINRWRTVITLKWFDTDQKWMPFLHVCDFLEGRHPMISYYLFIFCSQSKIEHWRTERETKWKFIVFLLGSILDFERKTWCCSDLNFHKRVYLILQEFVL